ncbi:hypothetical protein [Panacagrimonas sp.]|uniref:hypothetical protein n=1 Tax=Panacagrimonas sp. TaxID=2480088 RepID=UPI003B51E231
MAIELKLTGYKTFVKEFRNALGVGVPANRGGDVVDVNCAPNSFRYKVSDLYLTHMKTGAADWREITRHNYSQMGIEDEFVIGGSRIVSAFDVALPSGTDLVMVILATSEAARSQLVYRIVQQMLQDPRRKLTWGQIKPLLIGSWIFNISENHKRRPIHYGALGTSDYYNDKAVDAIKAIRVAGFQLD